MSGLQRCMASYPRTRLICAVLGGLALGCAGDVRLPDPPPGEGDHPRPGLRVDVRMAPEAVGIARALGWTAGVPGAEVRVHRIGTDFAWETVITDGQGTAYLPQLVSGRYRLAAYRPLTDDESAAAGVSALAAGRIVDVAGDGTEQSVELVPNRSESLVISEVYAPSTGIPGHGFSYRFHMFFELYNNSDQTLFLDGLTFGRAQFIDIDTPHTPCAASAPFRKDPDGLWVRFLHRFPGGGGEYPLAPSAAVVVAKDAIDHSVIDPRFPDLSNADFELFGSADVDNPDVPNVVEVGHQSWFDGHGMEFFDNQSLFIAHEVDIASLERVVWTTPAGDSEVLRVSAADLIDVVWLETDNPLNDQQFERCDGVVHERFDQLGGGYRDRGVLTVSVHRVGLPGGAGVAGRLQDTNVSAVDLIEAPITPGTIR